MSCASLRIVLSSDKKTRKRRDERTGIKHRSAGGTESKCCGGDSRQDRKATQTTCAERERVDFVKQCWPCAVDDTNFQPATFQLVSGVFKAGSVSVNQAITPAAAVVTITGTLAADVPEGTLLPVGTITPFTVPRYLFTAVIYTFGNKSKLLVTACGQVFVKSTVDWPAGSDLTIAFNRINCADSCRPV